jgi:WD40 repeat protein
MYFLMVFFYQVLVWNLESGANIQAMSTDDHAITVMCLTVMRNGNLVGKYDDFGVAVWDPTSGSLIKILREQEQIVVVSLATVSNSLLCKLFKSMRTELTQ